MARNDSGLLALSFPSSCSDVLLVLNKLESGSGFANVSLRKMVPTSQAISNNMEQMAQGRT